MEKKHITITSQSGQKVECGPSLYTTLWLDTRPRGAVKELTLDRSDLYGAVRQSFDGDQLRIARELRNLTQTELAKMMRALDKGHGVTAAAISQFELGSSVPSLETIVSLVQVLEVGPEFLTSIAADPEAHLPAFFRSLRSTPAKDRKRARSIAQLVHRLASVIATHVSLGQRDIPTLRCDPFDDLEARRRQAERAAAQVRREWDLPPGPIKDVVATIERHGIVCAHYRLKEERVDAFSVAFSDFPVVILATDKEKWDRSRFDAAHELGHIVMHDEAAGVPEAEKQANEFAAAFLMPALDIRSELPNRADWPHLLDLKNKWGTSIASLLYRARTLGVMTERTYVGATKVMAARGWRRHEPLNKRVELPGSLRRAAGRAERAGVTLDQLRREAAIPRDLFDEVFEAIARPDRSNA